MIAHLPTSTLGSQQVAVVVVGTRACCLTMKISPLSYPTSAHVSSVDSYLFSASVSRRFCVLAETGKAKVGENPARQVRGASTPGFCRNEHKQGVVVLSPHVKTNNLQPSN